MTSIPAAMTAIEISSPGGPEVLRAVERPVPAAKGREVLIRVAAAGVNRPDLMQRAGRYPPPPGSSDVPGLEVSGTVVALGGEPSRWAVGDMVCALVTGGGYAEYCVAPAGQCLPVPSGLPLEHAAGVPETFFTVWTNVFDRGRLGPGEVLLVHGGGSGIGTTAIQLARALGARVLATAGSDEKCRACEALGAERAVNHRAEDFVEAARAATGGRGVDVVLDMVGGDYVPRNLECLAPGGRLVLIAAQRGARAEVNLVTLMQRRLEITGSTLRPRSVDEKAAIARALELRVWPLFAHGRVRPVVHAVLPLAEAAEAHRLLESGTHFGKVLLRVAYP